MDNKEQKPAKQSSGNSMLKNILMGVVTPVLAATIIYFLGFNNKDESKVEFLRKKEATEKTWIAYIQARGIFSAVMKKLGESGDIEITRNNINHEIETSIGNLENIKKEPNADQRVYSSVDIMIQQMKDLKPLMNKFLDDMSAYAATNPPEEEGFKFVQERGLELKSQVTHLRQRDSLRLAVYYDGMNKDYKIKLPTSTDLVKEE
ncbi:MAG TPA: hypothetical protein PLZ45_15290 [Ferruginibacter sp.]|nr:hypothetical protein [Chitinophagaceae bacterium]HRI26041.1 hypothetical protein [Ferruginibacter sp.]